MTEPDTSALLRRAVRRTAFHLLRAGLEGVKALEALVEELSRIGREEDPRDGPEGPERVRIDVE